MPSPTHLPPGADSPPSVKIPRLTLVLGILVLLGLVLFVVMNVGEAKRFARLLSAAKPQWMLVAAGLQLGTYLCAGAIWGVVAKSAGFRLRLGAMARMALEKLSVDQVLPTGGLAGSVVVFQAMRNLGLPDWLAMEALLMDTVAYYASFFLAILSALIALWVHGAMIPAVLVLVASFSILMVGVPVAIGLFLRRKDRRVPKWLLRIRPIASFLEMARPVSSERIWRPGMLTVLGLLNLGIFLLDGVTLWAMMQALGVDCNVLTAWVGLVMGSVAGAVSFLPGGVGGFEVGATTALTLLGVPMEAALAGALLLRGFTLWLPLVPGLWFARRDVQIRI